MKGAIFVLSVFLVIVALWMARYSLSPASGGATVAYKLDRVTGAVTTIVGNKELPVT